MTISYLSYRVPYAADRDCVIVIRPREAAYQAVCVNAGTRLAIGCPTILRGTDGRLPTVSANDVIRLIGGMYRLATVAVDIEADELDRGTRGLRSVAAVPALAESEETGGR